MRGASPPTSRRRPRDNDERRRRDDRPNLANYNIPTLVTVPSTSSNEPRKPRVRFTPPLEARMLSQLGSKTGFLRKQADNEPGKWTKYFFVLKPTTYLYYYNSQDDAEPRGIIDMEFLDDIRYNADCQQRSVGGSSNCFRVTGVLPPEFGGYKGSQKTKFRPLYLDTGSRDDARAWMEAFKHHKFDPQKEKDQETLLKTMMVVDKQAETLGEQARELAVLTQAVLQKGEQYVSKARGTPLVEARKHRRRGHSDSDGGETMEAVRRIGVLLDELNEELGRQKEVNRELKARVAEMKMEFASVKKREDDDYEREQEMVAYKREIERLNLELQHQAQVLTLKQRVAEDQEREQEVMMYRRKIDKLQLELERQAEDRDRVIDQYESRAIDVAEREDTIESRERAVAQRLQAVEQECYQRMREINREAQRRAKQQDDEFVQYQYDLLQTLKQFSRDPVGFEQFIDDATDKVGLNTRLRGPADDYTSNYYGKMDGRSGASKAGVGGYFQTPRLFKKSGSSGSGRDDYRLGQHPSSPSSVADTYDTERTSSNSFPDTFSSTPPQHQSVSAEMRRRLPKAWIYQESRVHPGLYFYFNTKTGEMRWTHPAEDDSGSRSGRGGRAQTMDNSSIAPRPVRRSTLPLNRPDSKARSGPAGMFEMGTMNEDDEPDDNDPEIEPSDEDKATKKRTWRPALPKFRSKSSATLNGEESDEKYSMLSFIGGPPGANTSKTGRWKLPKTPFGKRKVASPVPESPVVEEHPVEELEDGSTIF